MSLVVREDNSDDSNLIIFNSDSKTGISNVRNHKIMTIYTTTKQADTTEELDYTISHEVGHLMNLPDHYIESKDSNGNRYTPPEKGWEKNIMGQFWGVVEEKNIQELLEKNTAVSIPHVTDNKE